MDIDLTKVNDSLFAKSNSVKKIFKDPLNYKIQELDNGVKIFFIEDVDATKSAAVVDVRVGSDNDYQEYPGIAHFLEHMLFMGSEKYPDEDYFHNYISTNSGQSNAYTAHNHTCYYFTIPSIFYEKSLDIFSGFFISPLLRKDSVEREVKAVDSEHKKNINQDDWNYFHLCKKLFIDSHPAKKFSTGSLETLLGEPTDQNKQNLRNALVKFHEQHYSASNMTVYIYHNKLTPEFESMVGSLFSQIKGEPAEPKKFYPDSLMARTDGLTRLHFSSNDNIGRVHFMWEYYQPLQVDKALPVLNLLERVLTDPHKGSFYSKMVMLGYIIDIDINQVLRYDDVVLLSIDFTVTEKGYREWKSILSILLGYLQLIKDEGNRSRISELYEEFVASKTMKFIDYNKRNGSDMILQLVEVMYDYKVTLQNVLIYGMENAEFPETYGKFVELVDMMSLQNCKVITSNKMHTIDSDYEQDKDYKTFYRIEQIPLDSFDIKETDLVLPDGNEFVSRSVRLPEDVTTDRYPIRLGENTKHFWYYDQDNVFESFNSGVYVNIRLPKIFFATDYIRKYVHYKLYYSLLMEKNREILNNLESANYKTSISVSSDRINLSVIGPNVNFGKVATIILDMLFSYKTEVLFDEEVFNKVHGSTLQHLRNFRTQPPYQQLQDLFGKYLLENHISIEEMLRVTEGVTYGDVPKFRNVHNEIFSAGIVKGIFFGNIQMPEANQIIDRIENNIDMYQGIYTNNVKVGSEEKYKSVVESNTNNSDPNSAAHYLVKLDRIVNGVTEDWDRRICYHLILNNFLGHTYFDILRTKMQLGYIVGSTVNNVTGEFVNRDMYNVFIVQSPVVGVDDIKDHTELFLYTAKDHLQNMPPDIFQNIKAGITVMLSEKDKNVYDRVTKFNKCILESPMVPIFDTHEILIRTLERITHTEVMAYYRDRFIDNRKSILVGINR